MRAPSITPPLTWMLADIPATDRKIARYLGVSTRTVQRYRAANDAPRAVQLALFWETRWGWSAADAEAYNAALHWRQYAQALERQVVALRKQIEQLERLRGDGAANSPFWRTA